MNLCPAKTPSRMDGHRDRAALRTVVAWHGLPFYAVRLLERAIRDRPECQFEILTTASDDFQKYRRGQRIAGADVRLVDDSPGLKWDSLGLEPPDVFVFTSWSHPGYMALAAEARRRRSTRLVMMMDNIYHGRAKQWAGALWFRVNFRHWIDWLWVPGNRGRAFARFLGMPPDNVVEGLYGADPGIFAAGESGPRRDILFVGQLIERKGVPALIASAQADAGIRSRLSIVGAGPLASALDQAGVRTAPFAPAEQLARDYAAASMFVLPSEVDHWGVVLHEAALAGCLLAATRTCGAAADLVRHGENGFLMQASTPAEIQKAVAWHDGLSAAGIQAGRNLSRRLARSFGPEPFSRAFSTFLT